MRMEAPCRHITYKLLIWVYLHAYGGTYTTNQKAGVTMGLSPCVWRHLEGNS